MPNSSWVLNPNVTWVRFGAEGLLLSMPDGDQITFDRHCPEIDAILQSLTSDHSGNERVALSPEAMAIFEEVIGFLRARGLVHEAQAVKDVQGDWFLSYLLHEQAKAGAWSGYSAARVSVRGGGWTKERSHAALRSAGLASSESEHEDARDTLVAVCSDWDDHALFRRENERAVKNGQRITFISMHGTQVVTGPIVAPGESACFECFSRRVAYNTAFPEEFEALNALSSAQHASGRAKRSQMAAGMVDFVLTRHLMCAARELTYLAEPGVIQFFDCATLQHTTQRVLKVPRCEVCGRRAAKPQRSVRDLY